MTGFAVAIRLLGGSTLRAGGGKGAPSPGAKKKPPDTFGGIRRRLNQTSRPLRPDASLRDERKSGVLSHQPPVTSAHAKGLAPPSECSNGRLVSFEVVLQQSIGSFAPRLPSKTDDSRGLHPNRAAATKPVPDKPILPYRQSLGTGIFRPFGAGCRHRVIPAPARCCDTARGIRGLAGGSHGGRGPLLLGRGNHGGFRNACGSRFRCGAP